jgi:hypothetical protein
MPSNDKYSLVRTMILKGELKSFTGLVGFLKPTPLSRAAHTTPERFKKLLADPSLFTLADAYNIATLIGVDDKIILDMIYMDAVSKRKKKK